MSKFSVAAASSALLLVLASCSRSATPSNGPSPRVSHSTEAEKAANQRTGAADSLPASELGSRHVQDIAEFLQSRVAGLRVIRAENGDISLRIRGGDMSFRRDSDGSTTAVSAGEPLLVIDGMPVNEGQNSNTLRALNPNEIENIQVLKDVSSTSSYGMRGAHGVILITMKKHD
jgi:TonB-dependent SusC/RagA subfamily outer membrane receptor